jgi:hypothetical protein
LNNFIQTSKTSLGCASKHNQKKTISEINIAASPTNVTNSKESSLTYINLLRLSKGILWDVQAKQEALTETLGYIHQAISAQLLSKSAHDKADYYPTTKNTDDRRKTENYRPSHNSTLLTTNKEMEEEGGFNSLLSMSFSNTPNLPSGSLAKVQLSPNNLPDVHSQSESLNQVYTSPLISTESLACSGHLRNVKLSPSKSQESSSAHSSKELTIPSKSSESKSTFGHLSNEQPAPSKSLESKAPSESLKNIHPNTNDRIITSNKCSRLSRSSKWQSNFQVEENPGTNFSETIQNYKGLSNCWLQDSIAAKFEQELFGPLPYEPTAFHKPRKVCHDNYFFN